MHDEYDALIDNAVKSYAAAEPSPELATGILRLVQQELLPRRAGWKPAMALALLVATVVMTAVLLAGRLAMPPAPATVATVPAVPQIQAPPALANEAPKAMPARARRVRAEEARSTMRPLPMQYTRQELTMLSFVQRYPKEAAAIAEAQKQDVQPLSQQPITISRLRIAPLNIPVLNP
jgi:hypothetical protein